MVQYNVQYNFYLRSILQCFWSGGDLAMGHILVACRCARACAGRHPVRIRPLEPHNSQPDSSSGFDVREKYYEVLVHLFPKGVRVCRLVLDREPFRLHLP